MLNLTNQGNFVVFLCMNVLVVSLYYETQSDIIVLCCREERKKDEEREKEEKKAKEMKEQTQSESVTQVDGAQDVPTARYIVNMNIQILCLTNK